MVMDLGLEEKVVFTGSVSHDNTPEFFATCDVFVMPSREVTKGRHCFEGFGIVYLEANACAKPVIGGASGGVSDAIIHGQTGLLVNPYDVNELSDALELLLTDKKYANLLGERGRQRVEECFSWDKIAKKVKNTIEERNEI